MSGFELRVVDSAHRASGSAPALIDVDGDRVTVTHASFFGTIDLATRVATLERPPEMDAGATEIFQRVILSCALPLTGGVLLHAAGAVADGGAVAFCGRSGAGKTTMASLLPLPIISDELIPVRPGFVVESHPLRALFALGRASSLTFTRLSTREVMHRLVGVALVPPHPPLWRAALPTLHALATQVPAFALEWTPNAEDAAKIARELVGQDALSPRQRDAR